MSPSLMAISWPLDTCTTSNVSAATQVMNDGVLLLVYPELFARGGAGPTVSMDGDGGGGALLLGLHMGCLGACSCGDRGGALGE